MKKIISIFLCLFWMGFIFYNSSNNGDISNKRSKAMLNVIQQEVRQNTTIENTNSHKNTSNSTIMSKKEKMNLIIRKNAHAFEYFMLSIFICSALFSFNYKGKNAIIYILFIGLFYAVTDEFHQMFVPGRSSSVQDILIDFIGTIVGMILFYAVHKIVYCKR